MSFVLLHVDPQILCSVCVSVWASKGGRDQKSFNLSSVTKSSYFTSLCVPKQFFFMFCSPVKIITFSALTRSFRPRDQASKLCMTVWYDAMSRQQKQRATGSCELGAAGLIELLYISVCVPTEYPRKFCKKNLSKWGECALNFVVKWAFPFWPSNSCTSRFRCTDVTNKLTDSSQKLPGFSYLHVLSHQMAPTNCVVVNECLYKYGEW
jgi:hypothetical protein